MVLEVESPSAGKPKIKEMFELSIDSCLGNPTDRAWWAAVHGVAKSDTKLSGQRFHFQSVSNRDLIHMYSVAKGPVLVVGVTKGHVNVVQLITPHLPIGRYYNTIVSLTSTEILKDTPQNCSWKEKSLICGNSSVFLHEYVRSRDLNAYISFYCPAISLFPAHKGI